MTNPKRRVFEELIDEVRASQTATQRFDQAVADALGLNRTDMRCLDVLDREGRLTAGQLAARTGLTSGAITTAIDRLEQAGHARRVHDTEDRRRVYVEATDEARRAAGAFYADHAELAERLYREHTQSELELLLAFVRQSREFNERKAAELEARLRG